MSNVGTVSAGVGSDAKDDSISKRIAWRIMPMHFSGSIIAYMDRVNAGFAKPRMTRDLKFSKTVHGLGAGIFVIGYLGFEVPGTIILAPARTVHR